MSTEPRLNRAEKAQETAEKLISTAHRAFAEQGFAATSLDALAADAGMTRGALHHHFGNKTGLFEAVLKRIDAEIWAAIDIAWAAEPDPFRAFCLCFNAYLDAALLPARRRILFQDAPAVLGARAHDIIMETGIGPMVEDLRGLIDSGHVAPVDPEALGHLLNGAVMNLAFWAAEAAPGENRLPRAHQTLNELLLGLRRR